MPVAPRFSHWFPACALLLAARFALPANAGSLYGDGQTGRSAALGGVATAGSRTPLDALSANPAALFAIRAPTLELAGTAAWAGGEFRNRANADAQLGEFGALPAAALSWTLGRLRFGLGLLPEIAARVDWRYRDTPGGADGHTTYGERTHRSELILLRTALAASWEVTPRLSLGASAGLLYNRNQLHAPYIFQSQPTLRGAKTLLDLETDGWGWGAQFGLVWKPVDSLELGLAYTSATRIRSEGEARADAGVQFENLGLGAARPDARYDAEVTNKFPQKFSGGAAWQAASCLTVIAQADWINWADAFDTLDVRLRGGNNRDLNGLLGSDRLDDDVPLRWRDQWVLRAGAELALTPHWDLRAGYAYAQNPIPGQTLTPLTAAITEHTITAGIGYHDERFAFDLAGQWDLPNEERIGTSDLASGEYSGSTLEISIQRLVLSGAVKF